MSETKFDLRWPRTPLSQNLREGEMATEHVIVCVERLEATNAKLLAALEGLRCWDCQYPMTQPDYAGCYSCKLAREAIREAKP